VRGDAAAVAILRHRLDRLAALYALHSAASALDKVPHDLVYFTSP